MNKLYLAGGVVVLVYLLAEHLQNAPASPSSPGSTPGPKAPGSPIPPAGDKPLPGPAPRKTVLASSLAQYSTWNVFSWDELKTSPNLLGDVNIAPGAFLLTNGADAAEPGFQGTALQWAAEQQMMMRRVFMNQNPIWSQAPDESAFVLLLDSAPPGFVEVVAG